MGWILFESQPLDLLSFVVKQHSQWRQVCGWFGLDPTLISLKHRLFSLHCCFHPGQRWNVEHLQILLQYGGAMKGLEVTSGETKGRGRWGEQRQTQYVKVCSLLTSLPWAAAAAADLPFVCLVCSQRSSGPRTQQTPLAVIPPRICGAQPPGSGCVPWTRSEGEHKTLLKSSSSKGNEIFLMAVWQCMEIYSRWIVQGGLFYLEDNQGFNYWIFRNTLQLM